MRSPLLFSSLLSVSSFPPQRASQSGDSLAVPDTGQRSKST
jgi:hypothetical protein